jgi:DNA-binding CsgD family transcriptional regulator
VEGIRLTSVLRTQDLDAVLRVLETAERARSIEMFREVTLDAMARHLGFRNSTFFCGTTPESTFETPAATSLGIAERLIPEYADRYSRHDIFNQSSVIQLLQQRTVASLDHISGVARGARQATYLENFLFRHRIYSKMVIGLRISTESTALIGIHGTESGMFTDREHALARILGRHLGNLLDLHRRINSTAARPVMKLLSPRQADVVALVAQGLTNYEISRALYVTTDTVKKHINHALRATGYQNRTQLALCWRSMADSTEKAIPGGDVEGPTTEVGM